MVVTGDKRALVAVARVSGFPESLAGRIVTVEGAVLALCDRLGEPAVRAALQPLLANEKTLRICFSAGNTDSRGALRSYFDDLQRQVQPLTLWDPTGRGGA